MEVDDGDGYSSLAEQLEILETMYPDRNLTALSEDGSKFRIDVCPNTGGDSRGAFMQCTVEFDAAGVSPTAIGGQKKQAVVRRSPKNSPPGKLYAGAGAGAPHWWSIVKSTNMDASHELALLQLLNNEIGKDLLAAIPGADDVLTSLNEEINGDCPICLLPLREVASDLASGSEAQQLFRPKSCFHAMHRDCVASYWSSVPQPFCPVCRIEASDEDFLELGVARFVPPADVEPACPVAEIAVGGADAAASSTSSRAQRRKQRRQAMGKEVPPPTSSTTGARPQGDEGWNRIHLYKQVVNKPSRSEPSEPIRKVEELPQVELPCRGSSSSSSPSMNNTALQFSTTQRREFKERYLALKKTYAEHIVDAEYYRSAGGRSAWAKIVFDTPERALKVMLERRNTQIDAVGGRGNNGVEMRVDHMVTDAETQDTWKINYHFAGGADTGYS